MTTNIWGSRPDWLFLGFVWSPWFLYLALMVFVLVVLMFLLILYKIIQPIVGLCGVNLRHFDQILCDTGDQSPKCRNSSKSFLRAAWFYAKNPNAMLNIVKRNVKLLLKKSKLDKLSCQVCYTNCKHSLENEMKEKETKKIFRPEENWITCIVVYYPLLLTTYFWSKVAIFYGSNGKNIMEDWAVFGWSIVSYFIILITLYITMIHMNKIPTPNHMTKKNAVKFLSSLKLNCKLNIDCFREEEDSDDYRATVTPYTAMINVPVKEWMDNELHMYEDATNEIENILKKHSYFIARACFDCKPANAETEKSMQEFRKYHKDKNKPKHSNEGISADFSFEAMQENGEVVEDIVVYRDEYDVPNFWLGPLFPYSSFVLLLLGLALPVMLVLLLTRNVKRMVLSKKL